MSELDLEREQAQLRQLVGHRLGPYRSFNAVNRVQVWQWCTAMGDRNPLYLDDDYRRQTEFDRLVAPPAMMQVWTMRDFNDDYAPGSTDARPYRVFDEMASMGYPGNVAVSYDISFHRYLLEGERPLHHTTIVDISERKSTALGEGYFVTEKLDYSTEQGAPFAETLITYFQYKPKAGNGSGVQGSPNQAATDPDSAGTGAPRDPIDIDSSQIAEGDALPQLAIPITHRLIVGGAIATQDFIPVHHSVPAAKAAAMPDIFMNILTTSGLCARYLSDWAGPASRLRKLKFRLMAPNTPGDCMILTGQVRTVDRSQGKPLVGVDFNGANRMGAHVAGSAQLELGA